MSTRNINGGNAASCERRSLWFAALLATACGGGGGGGPAAPPDSPPAPPAQGTDAPFEPPAFSGSHPVGMATFHWTDSSRDETLTANDDDLRELMVHRFYPADAAGTATVPVIRDRHWQTLTTEEAVEQQFPDGTRNPDPGGLSMIRTYQAADCDDLLEVWARASAQAHPFLAEEFLELERDRVRNVYLKKAETWVFETDGHVVGFISLLGNEVGGIFVDPQWQRSGIGSALMDHAWTLRGELEVEAFRQNSRARAFYARYGFEPIRCSVHEEAGLDLIRLVLATDKGYRPV